MYLILLAFKYNLCRNRKCQCCLLVSAKCEFKLKMFSIVKNVEETAHILHTLSHIEYNNREVKSCALTLD